MGIDLNSGEIDDGATAFRTRPEAVARQLRNRIFDGQLKPGAPLRQEAIAAELGVSRIPVREALRLLESEGLVVIRAHSGARVAVLDFDECIEIYKIRERLEPLAFSESMLNLTAEQLATVSELAVALESLTDDPTAWIEGDRRFHVACYAGVSAGPLLRIIVGFWNTTQQYRRILISTFEPERYAIALDEHRLLVDAAINQDTRGGEDILRLHLERGRRGLAENRQLFDR